MGKTDWKKVKMNNPYNDDEVNAYQKDGEYYFVHVPTGITTIVYKLGVDPEYLGKNDKETNIEIELFSGRLHLFMQDLFGV